MISRTAIFYAIYLAVAMPAQAQTELAPLEPVENKAIDPNTIDEAETIAPELEFKRADDAVVEVDPNEIADQLNSQQQLEQSFTLTRTIGGEIETEKRIVVYTDDVPIRESEAKISVREKLRQAFDGEVLTRVEAFEEAKIDFTIADTNHNDAMTATEFSALVDSWKNNDSRQADAPNEEIERQRQYEAFLNEISEDAAMMQNEAYALEKFAFMAGASQTISRQDYIREYLLDFDSMDANKDTILKDEELMRFRALNRGEKFE